MRKVRVETLPTGAVLAKAIYNLNGGVVVPKAAALGDTAKDRLQKLGISHVYIEDSRFNDLDIRDTLDIATVAKASNALQRLSAAIESAKLPSDVQVNYDELQSIVGDIEDDVRNDDRGILSLVDVNGSNPSILRQINVATLAIAMALRSGIGRRAVDVGLGSLLCDIGEIKAPRSDKDNWEKHPIIGLNILRQCEMSNAYVRAIVYQHQERCDGSGFPRKLSADKIDPLVKTVSVADMYCSLISGIGWPEKILPNLALEYLMGGAGTEFDADAVKVCLRCLAPFPEGTAVKLSSLEIGIVVKVKREMVARPTIRVINDHSRDLEKAYDLDLSHVDNQSKVIVEVLD